MEKVALIIILGIFVASVAQNIVSTHLTDIFPLGTGTIVSLNPFSVSCQSFDGLLTSYVLKRPSDSTLQYSFDCVQAPSSQYLISTSNKETFLNDCYDGSIYYLYRHDVNCNGGLISKFQLIYISSGPSIKYQYTCSNYGTLICYTGVTVEKDANAETNQNVIYLDRFNDLGCNEGYALSSFVYSAYYYNPYRAVWRGKYTFTCCRVSQMTLLPSIRPTANPSMTLTMMPSALPTYVPTTSFPSVLPTTISPSAGPSSAYPSTYPTTSSPSNLPTSSSPTNLPTLIPSITPTTSSPTTFSPSINPSIQQTQLPTSNPTEIQPFMKIYQTLTAIGVIVLMVFLALLIIACTFTLCVIKLQQRERATNNNSNENMLTINQFSEPSQYQMVKSSPSFTEI
mmetsp:Transcript_1359/g.2227  ORF Transcript_1359/g.2227 Transcript_1359/m.2227 type:complete len:397 (+) Transcript_1359:248-1438(+)